MSIIHEQVDGFLVFVGPLATDSALKFISLCRKCLERADDLIKTLPVHSGIYPIIF